MRGVYNTLFLLPPRIDSNHLVALLLPFSRRPLQWAVQNKHDACVKTLMELYPESSQMNVLDRNGFGKSALTDVRIKHT